MSQVGGRLVCMDYCYFYQTATVTTIFSVKFSFRIIFYLNFEKNGLLLFSQRTIQLLKIVFNLCFCFSCIGMEWSNEMILKFLNIYENEPMIWNASHPEHKNRNAVHDAWKRIETQLGNKYSVTDLKKKKESLMASFRTRLRKVKESKNSGGGFSDEYKPAWFAYEAMARFLLKDKDQSYPSLNIKVGIYIIIDVPAILFEPVRAKKTT